TAVVGALRCRPGKAPATKHATWGNRPADRDGGLTIDERPTGNGSSYFAAAPPAGSIGAIHGRRGLRYPELRGGLGARGCASDASRSASGRAERFSRADRYAGPGGAT